MLVKEIATKLELKHFNSESFCNKEVIGGYSSDLLSDVMGYAKEGQIWITLQTHKNIIAVATLKDIAAIILVKGFEPDNDTIEAANNEEIALLGTEMETFELSGKLYNLLIC